MWNLGNPDPWWDKGVNTTGEPQTKNWRPGTEGEDPVYWQSTEDIHSSLQQGINTNIFLKIKGYNTQIYRNVKMELPV
jgi:hypothetical protein